MITLFLTGVVAMIMLRTLKKDISTYNEVRWVCCLLLAGCYCCFYVVADASAEVIELLVWSLDNGYPSAMMLIRQRHNGVASPKY